MNNGLVNDSKIDFGDGHEMIVEDQTDSGTGMENSGTMNESMESEAPDSAVLYFSLASFSDHDYLTRDGLCDVFKCAVRTVNRMVERYEIPPPIPLGGRNVWVVGRLKSWVGAVAECREGEALKMARKLNMLKA